jgi:hypothetical protein
MCFDDVEHAEAFAAERTLTVRTGRLGGLPVGDGGFGNDAVLVLVHEVCERWCAVR